MKTNIVIFSDELTKEDIRLLLQAIRDCEQKLFSNKEIGIAAFVPELTHQECEQLLTEIKPPFKYGPVAMGGKCK